MLKEAEKKAAEIMSIKPGRKQNNTNRTNKSVDLSILTAIKRPDIKAEPGMVH
jgi:hypothetical protein